VNNAKVAPKVVQTILRHSRIQTTLDIYTQGDGDETRAVQCAFLTGDVVLASNCCFANPFSSSAGQMQIPTQVVFLLKQVVG
jgi:hypothetical protein